MKKILFFLLLVAGFAAQAQVYNNEWIDFSKTYYKFKVGSNGLRRISQTTLSAAGLGSVPAEQFQLWRNGTEVPIYTSVPAGTVGANDYIEFWGQMNDGAPDRALYKDPEHLLNDRWSLQTDTATYFLTVNPAGNNRRLLPTVNDVAGNSLPAETYFMHKVGNYYKNQINSGYAVNVTEYLYSSTYDRGEGWSSSNIGTNGTNSTTLSNLFPYTAGPDAKFTIALSGNATNTRRYRANLNGDSLIGNQVNFLNILRDSTTFPVSRISAGSAAIAVSNITTFSSDRMVVHQYELTYPRLFNFGNSSNFEFVMPASGAKYLEITNFNTGGVAPVLYDLTNGKRYMGDLSAPGMVKVVLEASPTDRQLVLVRQQINNITDITSFQTRTFTDYSVNSNQGDYLIISNPLLFTAPNGGNPVEEYRAYRASSDGGSYNAKIFLIDDLVDQFAFGIKKHPVSIRNFLMYARERFSTAPKHAFLIGKPVNYVAARNAENTATIETLNLVPTFGNPASDIMLSADPGTSNPKTSIGRISVVNGQEVRTYLDKIKQFETAQRTPSPLIADKAWMKNVVHAVGISEPEPLREVDGYMTDYRRIISDTLFGGKVTTFTKSSANSVEQVNSGELDRLFAEGITLLTYFGHSSANTLEFNLNNPDQYNNTGKYPMFIALGCNAGNFFGANRSETLSEKFVLAPQKGSIGFLASSHFGLTTHLDIYTSRLYNNISQKNYGKTMGEIILQAVDDVFASTSQDDFYARVTCEESILHADPAIRLNPHPKPDYVMEDALVRVNPAFVSIADANFNLKAKFFNIGKAVNKNIALEVRRQYPNGSSEIIFKDTIPGIRYADSLEMNIPIDPLRDKGNNKITVSIDTDNGVDEIFETNNSITKDIVIFEDEARPVYPYNFSIVNKQSTKFVASTANPFRAAANYVFEIDTTALFNSSLKNTISKNFPGGILEFLPTLTYLDSTVYYWRVGLASASGTPVWTSYSSFIYLNGSEPGFNQSHYFQHTSSEYQRMKLDSASRNFDFNQITNELYIRNGVWGGGNATGQEGDLVVNVNGQSYIRSACNFSLTFNVFDSKTFAPWQNENVNAQQGLYGSNPYCGQQIRKYNFEFPNDTSGRRKAMQFLRQIPAGNYIVFRTIFTNSISQFVDKWIEDESLLGAGNSMYTELKTNGFSMIDSFYRARAMIFVYKKGASNFSPQQVVSQGRTDVITLTALCPVPDSIGFMRSPVFGPAKAWKTIKWRGNSVETASTDKASVSVFGIKPDGSTVLLHTELSLSQQDFDISSIDASQYPYLQLRLSNKDSINYTPYQLKYWRVLYTPKPEGAVAPNLLFNMKDSLEVGEPIEFKLAFKNISDVNFDSIKVKAVIMDRNNVTHTIPMTRLKALVSGDTAIVHFPIDTRNFVGSNSLLVDINPDNDQPEQYHFNNFIYKNFYVFGDTLNPLLDVTFDNMHILNGDIVAAKPTISIKLSDNAKFRLLNDTSLVSVKVRYPNGDLRPFHFNNDTLRFVPAQSSSSGGNIASAEFLPSFTEDGDYELIVSGEDKSSNRAGDVDYRVSFQVINKPMISNMLNYPNPFTTSTAFVFTITGAEVPQNLKIQILTVTGKVVREITKAELGNLRVGRNITDFKWDGTDQYGQPLGNGVYIYRVVTNLNGKSLDKYKAAGDKTDRYFNNGYGKMYLMR